MRSRRLGGCNRKVVGFYWFVLPVVSAKSVEVPKPLNAGVDRWICGGTRLSEIFENRTKKRTSWTIGRKNWDIRAEDQDMRTKGQDIRTNDQDMRTIEPGHPDKINGRGGRTISTRCKFLGLRLEMLTWTAARKHSKQPLEKQVDPYQAPIPEKPYTLIIAAPVSRREAGKRRKAAIIPQTGISRRERSLITASVKNVT